MTNRFCYNYKAPGFIQPCCPPVVAATNSYLSSISCLTLITNGQTKTTQSALLAYREKCFLQNRTSTTQCNTIQSTIQNTNAISDSIYSQLVQLGKDRYTPYQPYIYPVVPLSVIQLQMATANVGVPMTPITCLTGKGNQTVTK